MPHIGGSARPEDEGPIARDFGSPTSPAPAPQFNHPFNGATEELGAARPRSNTGDTSQVPVPSLRLNSPANALRPQRRSTNASGHSLGSPAISRSRPRRSSSTTSSSSNTDSVRFRLGRASTVRDYHEHHGPGWQPGAEPGIDVNRDEPIPGLLEEDHLHEDCAITVVDFAPQNYSEYELQNTDLRPFLERALPEWVECRWICVNGLSWDVIKTLGNKKGLHRLAIEDLINTRSRTKVDWYADQCYMLLTLQKLVRLLHEDDSLEDLHTVDSNYTTGTNDLSSRKKSLRKRFFQSHRPSKPIQDDESTFSNEKLPSRPNSDLHTVPAYPSTSIHDSVQRIRTLQRYRGGVNLDRINYLEKQSALTENNLAVSVEQVSMFLLKDNTVITFFEHSAHDVLEPILARIRSDETILRRTSDASMLSQAVIDTIIDLALPVAAAYDEALGDLELDVLTDPDISQPKQLYTLMSEVTLLKNTISPIGSLVNSLRDHAVRHITSTSSDQNANAHTSSDMPSFLTSRAQSYHPAGVPSGSGAPATFRSPTSVNISSITHTYLADVNDHIIALNTTLASQMRTAENLTSLIFNTMGAHQNETMKQLTTVTVFFLPLTFLAGYFGMNFHEFPAIENSDGYFWYVAVPVTVATMVFISWGPLSRWAGRNLQRLSWWRGERKRDRKERKRIRRAVTREKTLQMDAVRAVV